MKKKYEPTWTSLTTYPLAQWFRDAKFGIYTHWGPYSVPAYGENGSWYPKKMYNPEKEEYRYHCKTYGSPEQAGYKDFIPLFKAEKFDADEWADLFARSGAKFAGPVAEHHDGFSMWDSKLTKWNSVAMGPKRNIVGELEKAIRARKMKYFCSFHHAFNWWFFPTADKKYDCSNPEYAGLYSRPHPREERPDKEYLDIWKNKLIEVVDRYQPDMLWFDFCLGKIRESYRRDFLAYYYNQAEKWDREVVVAYKAFKGWHDLPPMAGLIDFELGKMHELTPNVWLTDTSVDAGGHWSYVKDMGYKSVASLIHGLVDRVSKNGYLLLNVGPRPDGTIPKPAQDCLLGIGKWLEVNGEAIFGTTPWFAYGEGPTQQEGGGHFNEKNEPMFTAKDIRFTTKDNALYAICLGQPGDQVTIGSLKRLYPEDIVSVRMLGAGHDSIWRWDSDDGLIINVPRKTPSEHAVAFRVTLKRP
jgi:alpha-L-fucosidase